MCNLISSAKLVFPSNDHENVNLAGCQKSQGALLVLLTCSLCNAPWKTCVAIMCRQLATMCCSKKVCMCELSCVRYMPVAIAAPISFVAMVTRRYFCCHGTRGTIVFMATVQKNLPWRAFSYCASILLVHVVSSYFLWHPASSNSPALDALESPALLSSPNVLQTTSLIQPLNFYNCCSP